MPSRFDYRTKDEFAADIKKAHILQNWLMSLWVEELKFRGYNINYFDNGCGNDGEYLERPTKDADYKISINDETYLIEVKTNPIGNKKATFKVDGLRRMVKDDAWMLLVNEVATQASPDRTDPTKIQWALVSPATISNILDFYPAKSYGKIMGGKPSVMIPQDDWPIWFNLQCLRHITGEQNAC